MLSPAWRAPARCRAPPPPKGATGPRRPPAARRAPPPRAPPAPRGRPDAEGVPIVLNARTDVYLRGADDPEAAILRGQAYARAGADCIFVPGVTDAKVIKARVDVIDAPVSILARPGAPSVSELQELGV